MKKNLRNQQKFTTEFKQEAVKLVLQQGYSQTEAANSLGVSSKNISRWVKEYHQGAWKPDYKPLKLSEEQQELQRLRKENQRLKMERDILKKAAAFFANESN